MLLTNDPFGTAHGRSPTDGLFDLGDFVLQCGATLRGATLAYQLIQSVWGHQAGNGLNPVDSEHIDQQLKKLLQE